MLLHAHFLCSTLSIGVLWQSLHFTFRINYIPLPFCCCLFVCLLLLLFNWAGNSVQPKQDTDWSEGFLSTAVKPVKALVVKTSENRTPHFGEVPEIDFTIISSYKNSKANWSLLRNTKTRRCNLQEMRSLLIELMNDVELLRTRKNVIGWHLRNHIRRCS